ncbi:DNA polymerase III, delta subunit [Salinibacillus kushneri]|uniref:DNA polymerase III subunit delta n=1 Tax=Salinibacillus kushneri TaxID=237682 RepID=A0A1I0G3Q2_9BACI|nr:DNA polymerase III subunit delta [Salinibacillus kushneri]SET65216.1 DNA polymerase III, delta subunit [Salinibacillus kushneri]
MSYVEAVKSLKEAKYIPLYLLFGSESYLIQDLQHKIIHSVLEEQPEQGLNFNTFDLEETPVQEAILDAETFPFFGDRKVLVLKNASFFKAKPDKTKVEHDLSVLENYLENPVDYTNIILIAPYEKIDERKKIIKKLKNTGRVVKCDSPKEYELKSWIDMLAKDLNVHIEPEASQKLIEEVGTELMAVQKELEKFSLYVHEGEPITREIVEKLVSRHTESSAFKMIDALMKKDITEAISVFKDLTMRNEEPIALVALLASQIRLILHCKLMKNKGYTKQQMDKQIKAHPYAIKMALDRERYFSVEQLYEMMNLLTNTDEQMKTGEMEKELAFELLLYRFMEKRVNG